MPGTSSSNPIPTTDLPKQFLKELEEATTAENRSKVYTKFRRIILLNVLGQGKWTPHEFEGVLYLAKRVGDNADFCLRILEVIADKTLIHKIMLISMSRLELLDTRRLGVRFEMIKKQEVEKFLTNLPEIFEFYNDTVPNIQPIPIIPLEDNVLKTMNQAVLETYHFDKSPDEKTSLAIIDTLSSQASRFLSPYTYLSRHKELRLSTLNKDTIPAEITYLDVAKEQVPKHRITRSETRKNPSTRYTLFITGSVDYGFLTTIPPLSVCGTKRLEDDPASERMRLFRDYLGRTCEDYKGSPYFEFSKTLQDACNTLTTELAFLNLKEKVKWDICFLEAKRPPSDTHTQEKQGTKLEELAFTSGDLDNVVKKIEEHETAAELQSSVLNNPNDMELLKKEAKEIFENMKTAILSAAVKKDPDTTSKAPKRKRNRGKPQDLTDHLPQVVGQCLAVIEESMIKNGVASDSQKFILANGRDWVFGLVANTKGKRICHYTDVISISLPQPTKDCESILSDIRSLRPSAPSNGLDTIHEKNNANKEVEVAGSTSTAPEPRDGVLVTMSTVLPPTSSNAIEQEVEGRAACITDLIDTIPEKSVDKAFEIVATLLIAWISLHKVQLQQYLPQSKIH